MLQRSSEAERCGCEEGEGAFSSSSTSPSHTHPTCSQTAHSFPLDNSKMSSTSSHEYPPSIHPFLHALNDRPIVFAIHSTEQSPLVVR